MVARPALHVGTTHGLLARGAREGAGATGRAPAPEGLVLVNRPAADAGHVRERQDFVAPRFSAGERHAPSVFADAAVTENGTDGLMFRSVLQTGP